MKFYGITSMYNLGLAYRTGNKNSCRKNTKKPTKVKTSRFYFTITVILTLCNLARLMNYICEAIIFFRDKIYINYKQQIPIITNCQLCIKMCIKFVFKYGLTKKEIENVERISLGIW